MAKKSKRRSRRQKSNVLPLVAIGVGVLLLMRNNQRVPLLDTTLPTLPGAQPTEGNTGTAIGIRPDRRRYLSTYI